MVEIWGIRLNHCLCCSWSYHSQLHCAFTLVSHKGYCHLKETAAGVYRYSDVRNHLSNEDNVVVPDKVCSFPISYYVIATP